MKRETKEVVRSIYKWILKNRNSAEAARDATRSVAEGKKKAMLAGKTKSLTQVLCLLTDRYGDDINFPKLSRRVRRKQELKAQETTMLKPTVDEIHGVASGSDEKPPTLLSGHTLCGKCHTMHWMHGECPTQKMPSGEVSAKDLAGAIEKSLTETVKEATLESGPVEDLAPYIFYRDRSIERLEKSLRDVRTFLLGYNELGYNKDACRVQAVNITKILASHTKDTV